MEHHKLHDAPVPSVYLVEDWCTPAEELYLMDRVHKEGGGRWTQLSGRRLQNWGGTVHEKGMIPQKIPEWLKKQMDKVEASCGGLLTNLNHVLVNEYQPGEGIMSHQDGPLYTPAVAIISLGSSAVMRFTPHQNLAEAAAGMATAAAAGAAAAAAGAEASAAAGAAAAGAASEGGGGGSGVGGSGGGGGFGVWLPPRSLLLFTEEVYTNFLHGIQDVTADAMDDSVVNWRQGGEGERIHSHHA